VGVLAKIFWSGRSQAVRLPKEFRFEGREVRISREGAKVILEPLEDDDDWVSRIAGALDEDFARAALEDRPGPDDYERPDISFD
jgi:antitoxin VapB